MANLDAKVASYHPALFWRRVAWANGGLKYDRYYWGAMTGIRISFVLASYNGAKYIEAQLRSILEAISSNDEVVISDDSSEDETASLVESIGDSRLILLKNPTRVGYQKNFERAINAARGKYVFFSDQDDICLPVRITTSLQALETHDCVCGDAILVDDQLKETASSYFEVRRARFSALALFLRPSVIGATLACRRSFVLRHMPFPAKVPHDMWLSVIAALRGRLIAVDQPFILYRRHESAVSATGTKTRRKWSAIVGERTRLMLELVRRGIPYMKDH